MVMIRGLRSIREFLSAWEVSYILWFRESFVNLGLVYIASRIERPSGRHSFKYKIAAYSLT